MKGIQNKKCISRKLIIIPVSDLFHRKGTLKVFSQAWLTRMRQLVTFGELNNEVDTTGTGSMHVVASRLGNILRLSSVVLEGNTYGR
jgi:hypothetical protein